MKALALAGGLAAAIVGSALAQSPNSVVVTGAWARATPPGMTSGVLYLTLESRGGDRLVGASTPAASRATLHREEDDGGIMRMRNIEGGLALPPGKPIVLAPGGLHIMIEGLKTALRQGGKLTVHLTFANSPPEDVNAQVLPIGAGGPAMTMPPDTP